MQRAKSTAKSAAIWTAILLAMIGLALVSTFGVPG
jgi:hypothetical protein